MAKKEFFPYLTAIMSDYNCFYKRLIHNVEDVDVNLLLGNFQYKHNIF